MVYNVQEFGAAGDENNNDASAIQAAIDTCFSNGRGWDFQFGRETPC